MMTIARTMKAATLCSVLLASAAFGADKNGAELFPKYKSGDSAQYTFEMTRNEKTVMPEQPSMSRTRTITQNAKFKMEVVEASESGTTISLTLSEADCKVQDPNKSFEFKSSAAPDDSDRDNVLLRAMRPVIGSKVMFKFDPKGNLVSCTTDADLAKASQFSLVAEQLVGEQWAKFRWAAVFYPKTGTAATKVSDTWTMTQGIETPSMGRFESKLNFKLAGVNDTRADISAGGALVLESKPVTEAEKKIAANKGENASETKSPFELNNSQISGMFTFDTAKYAVTTAEWNEKVNLTVNAQGIVVNRESETQVKIVRND